MGAVRFGRRRTISFGSESGSKPMVHIRPSSHGAIAEHIILHRSPFGGRLYRMEARKGIVTATEEGNQRNTTPRHSVWFRCTSDAAPSPDCPVARFRLV